MNTIKTEVNINGRIAKVELLKRVGNELEVSIDGVIYKPDLVKVGDGIYSALLNGKSYNIEMVNVGGPRNYAVNTFYNSYDIEIIDPQSRYMKNRAGSGQGIGANAIVSPMPGKIIRIPVNEGDEVETGQTVMIISAMKMESEFKAPRDAKVKKIHVAEGDNVDGNKVLLEFE